MTLYEEDWWGDLQQSCASVSTGDRPNPGTSHFLGAVRLCFRASVTQKCSEPCGSRLSADNDTTRGGSLSLQLPENRYQPSNSYDHVCCQLCLSACCLHRIAARRLSPGPDTFLSSRRLRDARRGCAGCLLPRVPCLPGCRFVLYSCTACSFEDNCFSLVCVTCLDKPSWCQHTRCLAGYPAHKVLVPR